MLVKAYLYTSAFLIWFSLRFTSYRSDSRVHGRSTQPDSFTMADESNCGELVDIHCALLKSCVCRIVLVIYAKKWSCCKGWWPSIILLVKKVPVVLILRCKCGSFDEAVQIF